MSKSNALENELLNLVLGGSSFSPAANVWIALYTTLPSDVAGGTEVTGGSYARVMVANDLTTWTAAASGAKSNAITVAFAQATADWGLIVGFAIHRHATNDDKLYWGTIAPQRSILNGGTARFEPGSLVVTED